MQFKKAKQGGVAVELGPEENRFSVIQSPLPVFRLNKILVPVDFSECSMKALQYAIPFARQFGAELLLIHVVEPCVRWSELGPIEPQELHDIGAELERLKRPSVISPRSKPAARLAMFPMKLSMRQNSPMLI